MGGARIEIDVHDPADIPAAVEALRPLCADGCKVRDKQRVVTLPVSNGARLVPEVVRAMDAAGIEIDDLVMRRPTLDDVFLNLTGHRAEQPAGDGSTS